MTITDKLKTPGAAIELSLTNFIELCNEVAASERNKAELHEYIIRLQDKRDELVAEKHELLEVLHKISTGKGRCGAYEKVRFYSCYDSLQSLAKETLKKYGCKS